MLFIVPSPLLSDPSMGCLGLLQPAGYIRPSGASRSHDKIESCRQKLAGGQFSLANQSEAIHFVASASLGAYFGALLKVRSGSV